MLFNDFLIFFRENMFLVSSEDTTEQSILMQIKRSMGFGHKSRSSKAIQMDAWKFVTNLNLIKIKFIHLKVNMDFFVLNDFLLIFIPTVGAISLH